MCMTCNTKKVLYLTKLEADGLTVELEGVGGIHSSQNYMTMINEGKAIMCMHLWLDVTI